MSRILFVLVVALFACIGCQTAAHPARQTLEANFGVEQPDPVHQPDRVTVAAKVSFKISR